LHWKIQLLFKRVALSKDKKGVLELAAKGSSIEKSNDLIKDPYVFEFLNFPERDRYSEQELRELLGEEKREKPEKNMMISYGAINLSASLKFLDTLGLVL
jgi:predicted nuclease of restriction endonuclease-like (RecB) superfamily